MRLPDLGSKVRKIEEKREDGVEYRLVAWKDAVRDGSLTRWCGYIQSSRGRFA